MTKGTSYNLDLFSAVRNCSSLGYNIRSGSGQNMARCIMENAVFYLRFYMRNYKLVFLALILYDFQFYFIYKNISLFFLALFHVIFNNLFAGSIRLMEIAGMIPSRATIPVSVNTRLHCSVLMQRIYEDTLSDQQRDKITKQVDEYFV